MCREFLELHIDRGIQLYVHEGLHLLSVAVVSL